MPARRAVLKLVGAGFAAPVLLRAPGRPRRPPPRPPPPAPGAPSVRVFGDNSPPGEPREEAMKRVIDGFREMAAHAKAAGVVVLIESHGDFTHSPDLEEVLIGVGSDAFALPSAAPHTFRG